MVIVKEQWVNFPRDNYIVATTFNFDWAVIESLVSLDQGKRRESVVIVDKQEHTETKVHTPPLPYLGKTYYVCPSVGLDNTFHPKVVIGIDGQELLVLVGSHNLTKNGTESNLEISSLLRIPLTEPHQKLIEEVGAFLIGLASCIPRDPIARDYVLNFCELLKNINPGKTTSCTSKFLHTFDKSIKDQIIENVPKINQVTIISPTHSSNSNFIEKTIELFGGKATFIVDPSRFSPNIKAKQAYEKHQVKRLEIDGHRPLHAKIIIFHTNEGDWTLYGSPNFTESALDKSVKDGGNVEAACLIPPSQDWNWSKLFEKTVGFSDATWKDFRFSEIDEEKPDKKKIIVEKWGYENAIGKAVIGSPGLADGTRVFVRLHGIEKKIEVITKNGQIIFKIPPNWEGATRYEVFDENENLLVVGDLNRTGAAIPKFEKIELEEAAQRRYWYFARRLHNPLPNWLKLRNKNEDEIDFLIDITTWRPGLLSFGWSPVSGRIQATNPEDSYSNAKKRLEEVITKKSQIELNSENTGSYSRELLNSLDLLIEATFWAGLYAENKLLNLALFANDICELMNLPCGNRNKPLTAPNIEDWTPHFYEPLEEAMIEKWKEYGPRLSLDVGILFNYWVYLHRRGIRSFDSRSYDAIIVTNKYYQIWKALQELAGEKIVSASRERVFDNRIDILSSSINSIFPHNLEELERNLKLAFEKCVSKLQK